MTKGNMLKEKLRKSFDFFKKYSDPIGYVFLLAFFVYMNYKMYTVMDYLIDSDMSSELVLARILASEKRFITTSWFYSSELRVLNTNLIFMPLFLLTDNWHTVRIAGIVLLDLVLFISFYYLAKQLNIKHIPWIAFLILGGVSKDYLLFVTLGSYYVPHFAISFFSIGLIFSIFKDDKKQRKIIKFIVLLALAFAAGLEGMRLVSICYLPLVASAFIYCFIKEFEYLNKGEFNFKEPSLNLLYLSILVFVVSFVGNLVNSNVLPNMGYTYKMDGTSLYYSPFSFDSVGNVIDGWLDVFGYQSDGLYVFSKYQLILKPLFAIYFVVVCWATGDIVINYWKYDKYEIFIDIYYLTASLIICALFIFTTTPYANRYLLPVSVFSVFIVGIFFTHYKIDWQKWLMIICIAMFVVTNTIYLIEWQKRYNRYNVANLLKVKDVLLENECYAGYSLDHWNGFNILTEYTDGLIETWRLSSGDTESVAHWLQPKSHLTKIPEGKVYLLLWKFEIENEDIMFRTDPGEYICYEDNDRILYIFDNIDVFKRVVDD